MKRQRLDYANVTGRRPGSFVRVAGRLLPGIRHVQLQAMPYARAWHESNVETLRGTGPLWVAIGDSMTLGMGADSFDHGWVGQLATRLRASDSDLRVLNLSASGARVADVLDQQLPALEALGVEPDLVTVLIGSNDLLSRKHRVLVPDQFQTLLGRLPDDAVVGNLPNPTRTVAHLNSILREFAAAGRLTIADMRQITSWRGGLAADYFHPNNSGHALIADQFEHAIRDRMVNHKSGPTPEGKAAGELLCAIRDLNPEPADSGTAQVIAFRQHQGSKDEGDDDSDSEEPLAA